jgi:hypothetical protein
MLKGLKLEDTPWQEKPIKPSMFFEDQISRMIVKAVHSFNFAISFLFLSS